MRNLFERLPPDSEVYAEIEDITPEARLWNAEMYMLANIFDAVQAVQWTVHAANSKNPPQPPKPIDRPQLKRKTLQEKRAAWPGKTIIDMPGGK